MLPIRKSYNPMYISDFFENDFDSFFNTKRSFTPAVNIREDEKEYNIEMALPGMDKNEIKIEIEKNLLTISSEIETNSEESKNGYSRREFGYKSFCRNFTLPDGTESEKINASYKNGILNIGIPKSKEDVQLNRVVKIS